MAERKQKPKVQERCFGPWIGGTFERAGGPGLVALAGRQATARVQLSDGTDLARALEHARAAQPGWSRVAGPARGRLLLDLAERLVGRGRELVDLGQRFARVPEAAAEAELRLAVERLRWLAGCADKLGVLLGSVDVLQGGFVGASICAPRGVVVLLSPARPPLLGLLAPLAAALVTGNAVVAVVPREALPLAATLAEALATTECGGGVANLLSVEPAALVPSLTAGGCDTLLCADLDPRTLLLLREAAADGAVPLHQLTHGFDEPSLDLLAALTAPRSFRHPLP